MVRNAELSFRVSEIVATGRSVRLCRKWGFMTGRGVVSGAVGNTAVQAAGMRDHGEFRVSIRHRADSVGVVQGCRPVEAKLGRRRVSCEPRERQAIQGGQFASSASGRVSHVQTGERPERFRKEGGGALHGRLLQDDRSSGRRG